MDDYAGRVLADRYRLPLPPSDAFELVETRAFDTYSGQEVLVRQIPLPEVVDAEVVGDERTPGGTAAPGGGGRAGRADRTAQGRPSGGAQSPGGRVRRRPDPRPPPARPGLPRVRGGRQPVDHQ
ncbi:hypothetical protein ACFQ2B_13010 [Streptomyces stramineus]